MAHILTLLGTRPEIIKLSPLIPLLTERFKHTLVHSGQHYSYEMDALFFEELRLPTPDHTLNVGSASHGEQTARMLSRLEPILLNEQPDGVIVQGDTNTALAGALAAAKLQIPVFHVESGCRSFNRTMPEELNRVMIDHISSLLFAPSEDSQRNLLAEGLPAGRISLTGSTAIDACERNRHYAAGSPILEQLELVPQSYLVLTLHRAENTDPQVLPGMIEALGELALKQPIIFPIHPRTEAALKAQGLSLPKGIRAIAPLGYIAMLRLVSEARAVLTDSGGLQEEAAALHTPALILRQETEWIELVEHGILTLAGNSYATILEAAAAALHPDQLARVRAHPPVLHSGASKNICDRIERFFLTGEPIWEPMPEGHRANLAHL